MEIFVSNLPHLAGIEEIEALFATYGKVEKIKILKDKFSDKPRGMAFVEMAEDVDIKNVVNSLNGYVMQDRALKVEKARSRTSKNGGFNGFRPKTSFDFDKGNGKKRVFKDFSKGKRFPKSHSNFSKYKQDDTKF